MGWSCSKLAGMRADAWRDACYAQTRSQNVFISHHVKYFFEEGREQRDGAIVGSICRELEGGMCRRSSSFRIEPNGKVSRAPKFLKDIPCRYILWDNYPLQRWDANCSKLEEFVIDFIKSGNIPMPKKAQLMDMDSGVVVEEWFAPMFLVI